MPTVNCKRCAYYFVTWEPQRPHGCRYFGFKSMQIPSIVVKRSSGNECGAYKAKIITK
ncbi:uracil-DNA glycosylase [Fusibacter sp. A1]|nr:uracil-DNA glycosylase [Fusibacter sp. A1]RXV62590.1 uracil-DNA glycosylase [Fusibacter sp. A1]